MIKKFIVVFSMFAVIGCATPDYNYRPSSIDISEPPLDSVHTAYVGDVMLKQGKYKEYDSLYLPHAIDISWSYNLGSGYYLKLGEDEDTESYAPGGGDDAGHVEKAALADPWEAVMAYKDKDRLCIITTFNAISCKNTSAFERKRKPMLSEDSFQQTLIYSGKIDQKINIGYREFSGNLARPAFNNDVEYDLDESNIIGYKGARVEIIEATNESITYKVLRNFNAAEL